jgi:hypothetical protein
MVTLLESKLYNQFSAHLNPKVKMIDKPATGASLEFPHGTLRLANWSFFPYPFLGVMIDQSSFQVGQWHPTWLWMCDPRSDTATKAVFLHAFFIAYTMTLDAMAAPGLPWEM